MCRPAGFPGTAHGCMGGGGATCEGGEKRGVTESGLTAL